MDVVGVFPHDAAINRLVTTVIPHRQWRPSQRATLHALYWCVVRRRSLVKIRTNRWFLRAVFVVAMAGLLVTAIAAAPGKASPGEPGGSVLVGGGAQFTDNDTGTVYNFYFNAQENGSQAGVGNAFVLLGGPALSLCDTHSTHLGPLVGFSPLTEIDCAGSGQMAVSVDGCTANIEVHGFVHSDYPNVTYLGPMTIDLRFQKNAGDKDGVATFTVYTPKEPIKLHGKVTAGQVAMDTCP